MSHLNRFSHLNSARSWQTKSLFRGYWQIEWIITDFIHFIFTSFFKDKDKIWTCKFRAHIFCLRKYDYPVFSNGMTGLPKEKRAHFILKTRSSHVHLLSNPKDDKLQWVSASRDQLVTLHRKIQLRYIRCWSIGGWWLRFHVHCKPLL